MNTLIFVSIVVRRNLKKYIASFKSGKTSCIYIHIYIYIMLMEHHLWML